MNETEKSDQPQVVFDRRPLWIVILDRMRFSVLVAVLLGVFFILLGRDTPEGLTDQGYKVLCLFFLCVSLWSTNAIPLSATSLLAIGAVPLLGIMDASQVYAFFGNKAVFFILGAFILSGSMIACGLSARMSFWVMEKWGHRPRALMSSIYFFGAVSSCFMSEHAVAAMLFPIVVEIANILKLSRGQSAFAKSLFFALAWGCIIGGATTVLGGGRVPLAVEMLEKGTHNQHTLGIMQYTQLSLPLIGLLLAIGWGLLNLFFKPEIEDVRPALQEVHKKSLALGKVSYQEMGVGTVMGITLFFWFGLGETLGIANISLMAIVLLFILQLITWKTVEPHVNWAIILMYGGAICLGQVMASSGAASWLAQKVFLNSITSPVIFLLTVAVLSTLFTTFMNNSAVIAILLPPVLSLCPDYGIAPEVATMTIILPSNFAFILPIATPASALAYASHHISLREMMVFGILLSALGMACFLLLLFVYWPWLGFS
ncbi:MAG: anion:sodium symporter [Nitrospinaceae bacterium]|nr:anion:sodium symporter [Nitrospinaceae bacterium]NIR53565.1 anion:sodium symporter [Nitrospinaceae bacterium]NIS83966.1 anion:sodium symporter [Nitrospinaceae bacterium]NIT80775.1 anion:sodium symporter [Nitrospinaceae bacterium]NIU43081.1 anion:sodium symporter [Nitrospinaceae bacterium]